MLTSAFPIESMRIGSGAYRTHRGRESAGSVSVQEPLLTEADLLNKSLDTLRSGIYAMLKAATDCVAAKQKGFLDQLKRMREISNASIRNAMQVGTSKSTISTRCFHIQQTLLYGIHWT